MKKGISTLACDGWTLEKSLKICRNNGIDALEIRMGLHKWSQLTLSDEEYRSIREKISSAGLCVSDLGTSVVVRDMDEAALSDLERCAQIANILCCKGLRIMLGWFYNTWSEPRKPMNYRGIIEWMKRADRIMAEYDTEVWIETHNEFATGKELNRILNDSGVAHFRLLWDIMHPIESGESIEDSFNYMFDRLAHVHIKDGRPWPDADRANYMYTQIGEGIVPIDAIVDKLQKAGYNGYYSLEWEGVWRKEIQGDSFRPEEAIRIFSELMDRIENK